MKFGYFDDLSREYVINTPLTPNPWINYLGSKDFFSLISNTCGGYMFYKDAKLRRITRFRYNNIPADMGGRYYYICDNDIVWNPGYKPTQTSLDSYECRHGLGYSIYEASKNNLKSKLICFVPIDDSCEINVLTIKNTSKEIKSVQIFSLIEWCLWDAVGDSTNFQRNLNIAEVEVNNNTIYHKTEYRERRNHYAFNHVNCDITGFDTDREYFFGQEGSWEKPQTVVNGKSYNSIAVGGEPIASFKIDERLEPDEEKTYIFITGYVENEFDRKFISKGVINKDGALKIINKYDDIQNVRNAFDELKNYWSRLLNKFTVKTDDDKFDRMINIWNQYQCMVTFNMSRSASYYESGVSRGMGFRDSCQDILGFVHLVPDRARQRILDLAAIQLEDGSTYHQYQPLTKQGNADIGGGFNDDPLWLIACTTAYIKETGDISILNEMVRFDNIPGTEKPLIEHLRASINYTLSHLGPHGLPLIGRADWNDCLNLNCFSTEPEESFQTCSNYESNTAESIFIAAMFVKYANEYIELIKRYGNSNESDELKIAVDRMYKSVIGYGWGGEWFLRAYDAFGHKVGSSECDEGKVFIEPQGFCVMAGIGIKEGMASIALSSVNKYLVNDYGIELLYPCYTEYKRELGEITSYPPGFKENGSVFSHNNPWIIKAYCIINDGDKAFDIYKKTSPAYMEDISDIRRAEPYVYCQTTAGRASVRYGEGKNSWLTGTAAWMFNSATQSILGIVPDYEGLRIRPCLPECITKVKIVRYYRGIRYNIEITNKHTGIQKLTVDGIRQKSDLIPFDNGKAVYNITVSL